MLELYSRIRMAAKPPGLDGIAQNQPTIPAGVHEISSEVAETDSAGAAKLMS
jgi:hypothetical protein